MVFSLQGSCSSLEDSSEGLLSHGSRRTPPASSQRRGSIHGSPSSRNNRAGRSGRLGSIRVSRGSFHPSPSSPRGSFSSRWSSPSNLQGRSVNLGSLRGSPAVSSVRRKAVPGREYWMTRTAVSSGQVRLDEKTNLNEARTIEYDNPSIAGPMALGRAHYGVLRLLLR